MLIKDLNQLIPIKQRAIIINHNTKVVTLLSLLSALRYTNVPVLLIDCESNDGSLDLFTSMMREYEFDLLEAPLKLHGETLDWLFKTLNDETILLIDSDLEILNVEIIDFMNKHISNEYVFGSSFLESPQNMKDFFFKATIHYQNVLITERPFIPISLFKVKYIKDALQSGRSFNSFVFDNQYATIPKKLQSIVKRFPKSFKEKHSYFFRRRYFTSYPRYVFYDTGASIYEYLHFQKELSLVSLPIACSNDYIRHFWGATRQIINNNHAGGKLDNEYILERLRKEFKVTLDL